MNSQPLYTAPAASVTKFCKAWATASAGKETFLKNIEPYVTSDVLEGLKDTDPRNLTTDNPTLTNIVINPVPGTERTVSITVKPSPATVVPSPVPTAPTGYSLNPTTPPTTRRF